MPALCDWGEIEISLGIARRYPGGEWDESEWDAAEWEESDTPLGDWLDVTCDCLDGLTLAAGSSRADGVVTRWEAATAKLRFIGSRYDPRTGPWQGLVGPGLPLRIRWRPLGGADPWAVAFTGSVDNGGYKWDPATLTAEANCSDRTGDLVAVDSAPNDPPVGADEWASARIHRLAAVASLAEDERDITSGGVDLIATDLEGPVWSQMLAVADTDIALLWVRRDGRLAYRPEGRVAENVPVNATLVPCPDDVPAPVPVPVNLLSDQQADVEEGTTTPAQSGATLTTLGWAAWSAPQLVGRDAAAADHGASSLALTRNDGTAGVVQATAFQGSWPQRIPVAPNTVYTVVCSVWVPNPPAPGVNGTMLAAQLGCRNAGGTTTTRAFTGIAGAVPGQWTQVYGIVTTTPDAVDAYLLLRLDIPAGGRARIDRIGLYPGQWRPADWVPPGATPRVGGNLVRTDQQASAEDGTTTGFVAAGGAALTNTADAADSGSRAIALTTNAAGPYLQIGASAAAAVPVTAGALYTFTASVRAAAAGRQCYLGIAWWNAAGASTFVWGDLYNLGAANTWTRLRRLWTAPAGAVGASLLVSPRGLPTDRSERALIDRIGLFHGDTPSSQWVLPSWTPPPDTIDPERIGYVNLLHADPEVLRNWVTIGGQSLPGSGQPDRPVATRIDSASVSRFRPQTYRAVDLLHADDAWSGTVADLVLADGAWPSTAPAMVELDTRTHSQPAPIAAVLLALEPEHVFTVVDPLDPAAEWRMIAAGWEVEVSRAAVAGTVDLEDVTGWGAAAGWDDPAPPHGWDIDAWALVGQGGGGGVGPGPGPGPSVITYALAAATDIAPPGSATALPLFDPGTGATVRHIDLPAGTYSLDALVTFAVPSGLGAAPNSVNIAVVVNGTNAATASGTTSMSATTPLHAAVPTITLPAPAVVELRAASVTIPGRAVDATYLTVSRIA